MDKEPEDKIIGKTEKPPVPAPPPQEGQEGKTGQPLVPWISFYKGTPAHKKIWMEAIYLTALLFLFPLLMYLTWINWLEFWKDPHYHHAVSLHLYAWLGGSLGGVLFDLKWLVYGVAKRVWLEDKQWWRYLTPHMSGAMAFLFILLLKSDVIKIFDRGALDKPSAVAGMACLIGYFSDKATGKLAEVAKTLFGETTETEFGKDTPQSNPETQPPNNQHQDGD